MSFLMEDFCRSEADSQKKFQARSLAKACLRLKGFQEGPKLNNCLNTFLSYI
ncbi:MAG: hypothetical protein ABH850_06755 [Candidatus Micrarchaeota archaeon]